MVTDIFIGLYVVVVLYCYRRAGGWILWDEVCDTNNPRFQQMPNGSDWAWAIICGFIFAATWPVSVPIWGVYRLAHSSHGNMFYCLFPNPSSERMQQVRIDQEKAERQQNIAALEQTVGIDS